MSELKKRMIEFLAHKGLSQLRFEKSVGLSRGFVNNMGDAIRSSSLGKISKVYPELNIVWLQTGIGSMLNNQPSKEETATIAHETPGTETATLVKMLPIAAQGGSLNDFILSVKGNECEQVVSPIQGADFAMPVNGESMAPEYPNGSRIFIKKIDFSSFIEWGKAYVLDTKNGSVIKILTPAEDDNYVHCVSINPNPIYAPFDIPWTDIIGVYRVLMCLTVK